MRCEIYPPRPVPIGLIIALRIQWIRVLISHCRDTYSGSHFHLHSYAKKACKAQKCGGSGTWAKEILVCRCTVVGVINEPQKLFLSLDLNHYSCALEAKHIHMQKWCAHLHGLNEGLTWIKETLVVRVPCTAVSRHRCKVQWNFFSEYFLCYTCF